MSVMSSVRARADASDFEPQAAGTLQPVVVDDQDWVRRIRAGDARAFQDLFLSYYDGLRAFLLGYVRSEGVAEELVQEIFLRLWSARAQWVVQSTVRSYLYGAARNRALRYLSHQRIEARWEAAVERGDEHPGVSVAPASADGHLAAGDLAAALARAVGRLPARCRETFTLRRQHDLSYVEIAAVMGVTVNCAERQFTKALKILRAELADFF